VEEVVSKAMKTVTEEMLLELEESKCCLKQKDHKFHMEMMRMFVRHLPPQNPTGYSMYHPLSQPGYFNPSKPL